MIYTTLTCALVLSVSGYPFISEPAGSIEEQDLVYVFHHLLLINTKIAEVPSMAFRCSFTRLLERSTTAGQQNQSTQDNTQQHFTAKNITIFHHFPFF